MRRSISTAEGGRSSRISRVALVATLAAALTASACGGEGARVEDSTGASSSEVPFPLIFDSSSLPADITLDPRLKTYDMCVDQASIYNKWGPNHLQPLPANDPVVTIDGRCNSPQNEETVGIYTAPSRSSELAPWSPAHNGMRLRPQCVVPDGSPVRDVRGAISSSNTWLCVTDRNGERGFVPIANAGYVDGSFLPLHTG